MNLAGSLTYDGIMMRVDIADAKTHLSRYLDSVEKGERVVICRRNVPIAEIHPVSRPLTDPRPVGIDREMTVPSSFFEPLPDDLLDAFDRMELSASRIDKRLSCKKLIRDNEPSAEVVSV